MTEDATFEEGAEGPLDIGAIDAEDLAILAALAQDAVFPASEMAWLKRERRFAILLNRFRWEDLETAQARGRPVERTRSLLNFNDVMAVASQGIDPKDRDTVLSLLDIAFEPGEDGTGTVYLILAGDGAIRLSVETLDARLRDVTRPYEAPSGHVPHHPG